MLDRETLLETRRFRVERVRYRTGSGAEVAREVVLHPGAAVIIPLVDPNRVCLERVYRAAVNETLIELPAGTLEEGEDPAHTAGRELKEETGYTAGRIEPLGQLWVSPGILRERTYIYLATELTAGEPQREANEEIENLIVPWSQAVEMCLRGEIHDAKSVAGILLYELLRK